MTRTSRRTVWLFGLGLAAVAVWLVARQSANLPPEGPPPSPGQLPGSTAPVAASERARASVEADSNVPIPAVAARDLRLVDLWDPAARPGGVRVLWDGGSATTAADGTFAVPADLESQIRLEGDAVRLVHPARPLGGVAAGGDVLVWRAVTVRGRVVDADGQPLPGASVTAAPIVLAEREWISDPRRPGSPQWLLREAPDLTRIGADVADDGSFRIVVPSCACVVLVGAASGHLPATASVGTGAGVEPAPVRIVLTRPRAFELRVADEDGRPLAGAVAQYFSIRRGTRAEIVPDVEFLLGGAAGSGFAAKDSPSAGTAEVAHMVGGTTDADGAIRMVQPVSATQEFVIVWADGKAAEIVRPSDPRWTGRTLDVAMRKLEPLVDRYRFLHRGEPLRGARAAVLDEVDGFTPGRDPVALDEEGSLSSTRIVPGRRYVVVIDRGKDVWSGHVEFGASTDIDVTHLLTTH